MTGSVISPKALALVCRYTTVDLDLVPESALEPGAQPTGDGRGTDDGQPMAQERAVLGRPHPAQLLGADRRQPVGAGVLHGHLARAPSTAPGVHRRRLSGAGHRRPPPGGQGLDLPWRVTFSFLSTLVTGVVLLVCIDLDGGLSSPLVILMALPVMSAALALPARQVFICGDRHLRRTGRGGHAAVGSTERFTSQFAMFCAFLVGTVVVNVGAAIYRSRLEAADARLLTELDQQAHTDSLTGCLNHGAFYERLDVAIERALRHREPLSLLVADVDRFKSFNDTHGHADGDAALVRTASILIGTCRSIDSVARIGGDEFAVILPSADLQSAAALARRLTATLNDSAQSEVTMSVGYATLDPNEPTSSRLFRDGDLGLYRAKELGRGRAGTVSDSPSPHRRRFRLGVDITDRPVSSSAPPTRLLGPVRPGIMVIRG